MKVLRRSEERGVDGEPGRVGAAAPLGFADGQSLAVPISGLDRGAMLGLLLGRLWIDVMSVETHSGDEPREAEEGSGSSCSPHAPCRNFTLKSMPLPMSDVAQAYRSSPEKTEEAVHKVGRCQLGGTGLGAPDTGRSQPLACCSSRPAWRGTSCGAHCPHRPSACSRASSPPLLNRFAGQIAAQGCSPLPQTTLASWCELLQAVQTPLHLS